jgi:predicted DNA-binding transcriptional regulator YafY
MSERLQFIDFRCLFFGEIRRADLIDRFRIGTAAATRDIAYYRQALGAKIVLDSTTKIYQIAEGFTPLFEHNIERALTGLSRGFGEAQNGANRPLLNCEVPPTIYHPKVGILAPICRAIYGERPIEVGYSSFTSGRSTREIVPFALANNGLRWHVRAFDRKRQHFSDFVLTRIHKVRAAANDVLHEHEFSKHDLEWGRVLELELVAHPKEKYADVIAMDHNMTDGMLKVRVRAALASYLLRQWIVDCSKDHSQTGSEYRLWLQNTPILYGIANAHLAPGYQSDFSAA